MKGWIAVDLDGTLAKYDGQQGIGEPVLPMLSRVKTWLKNGRDVRIFTVRAGDVQQKNALESWLKKHGISDCKVTNIKDAGMIEIWDDRAVRVIKNTGKICSGCGGRQNHSSQSGMVYEYEVDC